MSRKELKPQRMEDNALVEAILDYQGAKNQESTIKKIVHDLKTVRLYKFDDYIFEVYYI